MPTHPPERTATAMMDAPLAALLGVGLVFGVIWVTDRSKKPKDRILRPVKWR